CRRVVRLFQRRFARAQTRHAGNIEALKPPFLTFVIGGPGVVLSLLTCPDHKPLSPVRTGCSLKNEMVESPMFERNSLNPLPPLGGRKVGVSGTLPDLGVEGIPLVVSYAVKGSNIDRSKQRECVRQTSRLAAVDQGMGTINKARSLSPGVLDVVVPALVASDTRILSPPESLPKRPGGRGS